MPAEFTIQLYEPDQQIIVRQKPASWGGTPSYEFSMPQNTFRTPSASALDRSQSDPVADATVPKLNFVWKREGKITKDLSCYLTGKSTDPAVKKKHRDPDITVALFAALKEMTIYEPNLLRIEMEDPKGLEVVLLLGAAVIKDLFLTPNKDVFNTGGTTRKNSGGITGRKNSAPSQSAVNHVPAMTGLSLSPQKTQGSHPVGPAAAVNGLYQQGAQSRSDRQRQSLPLLQTSSAQSPPADPRAQWEIEAETARLKAAERERLRVEEARKRERQKADEAEAKRLQKMLDAEEKEKRRRQAEVDRETERLRQKYGNHSNLVPRPPPQSQRHSAPVAHGPFPRPYGPQQPQLPHPPQQSQPFRPPQQPPRPMQQPYSGPYLQPPGAYPSASTSAMFGSNGLPISSHTQKPPAQRKSFWNLRSQSESGGKLTKKKSSMW